MDETLRREVRFIATRLGAIIGEQDGGLALFAHVERLRKLTKAIRANHDEASIAAKRELVTGFTVDEANEVAHAFSMFFQLVNLCEEWARVRHLESNPEPAQSLRTLFGELCDAGLTSRTLQQCLDSLDIEPVLTAHPTEAKRRTTLDHILRPAAYFDHPDGILETLWQTVEVRQQRVGPMDEIDNAELSLAKTDLYIAGRYAERVQEESIRRSVFTRISEEYERTVRLVLRVTRRQRLLANQPVLAESIRLRDPYIDPLNYLQIRFLPKWRRAKDNERLRQVLALTVNGIAFGMKSTG